MGDVEDRELSDATGVAHCHGPGNYSAPIVSDHDSCLFSAGQDKALHITRQQLNAVCSHSGRFVREVVAAHVRGDHPEASLDQQRVAVTLNHHAMHMRAVEHTIRRGLCTQHAARVNHTENC